MSMLQDVVVTRAVVVAVNLRRIKKLKRMFSQLGLKVSTCSLIYTQLLDPHEIYLVKNE